MPYWDEDGLEEKVGINAAKSVLKSEMKKRDLTYEGLVEVLARSGIEENERNLRNKVSRGTFSAGFFFQCLLAMGVQHIDLSHLYREIEDILREVRAAIGEEK